MKMRYSKDEFDEKGTLKNGFDYDRQCWVEDYMILRCGHPETMDCSCFGRFLEIGRASCRERVCLYV